MTTLIQAYTLSECMEAMAEYASAYERAGTGNLIFCEDRTTHQCWPSIGKICQYTGMSANTVAKYIRQLEEKQLIDVEPTKVRTKSGEVRNGTLQFTIRPIQEAVNYKLEKDLSALPNPKRTRKRK